MGPRLVVAPSHRPPRRKRSLVDKLQELGFRSPQDLKSLEPLIDYALTRLDRPPRQVCRRLPRARSS